MLGFLTILYKITALLSWISLAVVLLILPLTYFNKLRVKIGITTVIASFVYGVGIWTFSALTVYQAWGMKGLIIGVILAGVGVVPLALIESALNSDWVVFATLLISTVLVIGIRFLGTFIVAKSPEENEQEAPQLDELHEQELKDRIEKMRAKYPSTEEE